MSYNTKNYTEQGGESTHIGGKLIIDEGGSVEGLPSSDSSVAVFPMTQSGETSLTFGELWNLFFEQGKIVCFIRNSSTAPFLQADLFALRKIVYSELNGLYDADIWDYNNLIGRGASGSSDTLVRFSFG